VNISKGQGVLRSQESSQNENDFRRLLGAKCLGQAQHEVLRDNGPTPYVSRLGLAGEATNRPGSAHAGLAAFAEAPFQAAPGKRRAPGVRIVRESCPRELKSGFRASR
jgi:hypothetical protein